MTVLSDQVDRCLHVVRKFIPVEYITTCIAKLADNNSGLFFDSSKEGSITTLAVGGSQFVLDVHIDEDKRDVDEVKFTYSDETQDADAAQLLKRLLNNLDMPAVRIALQPILQYDMFSQPVQTPLFHTIKAINNDLEKIEAFELQNSVELAQSGAISTSAHVQTMMSGHGVSTKQRVVGGSIMFWADPEQRGLIDRRNLPDFPIQAYEAYVGFSSGGKYAVLPESCDGYLLKDSDSAASVFGQAIGGRLKFRTIPLSEQNAAPATLCLYLLTPVRIVVESALIGLAIADSEVKMPVETLPTRVRKASTQVHITPTPIKYQTVTKLSMPHISSLFSTLQQLRRNITFLHIIEQTLSHSGPVGYMVHIDHVSAPNSFTGSLNGTSPSKRLSYEVQLDECNEPVFSITSSSNMNMDAATATKKLRATLNLCLALN